MQYNTKIFNEMKDITDLLNKLATTDILLKYEEFGDEYEHALNELLNHLALRNYDFQDHESKLNLELIKHIHEQARSIDYSSTIVDNLGNLFIGLGYDYDDLDTIIDQANADLDSCLIHVISKDSLLYQGLIKWYQNHDTLIEQLNAVEDKNYIYFITGSGYNYIDEDLLHGDGDDRIISKFIDMLNYDIKA